MSTASVKQDPATAYHCLAGNLRLLRVASRLSQQDLAKRVGFRQQYISDLERGRWPHDRSHVARLAKALGARVDDLLLPDLRISPTSILEKV